MKRDRAISYACFFALSLFAATALAKPATHQKHHFSAAEFVDVVGDVDGTNPVPQKVLQDTVWIATWTFDAGACNGSLPAGWQKGDNHIRTGGDFFEPLGPQAVFWSIDDAFDLTGGISGDAGRLGYINNVCAVDVAGGYSFGWYQGLRIEYEGGGGTPAIRFDYLLDSEGGFDFLRVEEDSACASYDRVNPHSPTMPRHRPNDFRNLLLEESGLDLAGAANVALTDFGPGTHCVYIAFLSDSAFDPFDGLHPTTIGAGLVVDNIELDDANGANSKTEDFAGGTQSIGTFMNMWDTATFGPLAEGGSWARTYDHITDNDVCTENTTCAVLATDFTTPSIANSSEMAFAPGGFVIKNWLDDIFITPWVSLASTPNAVGTFLSFRRFGGNNIFEAWIVQNWSVRGRSGVDDGMGGTLACVQNWGHIFQWNSLPRFFWYDRRFDASIDFEPTSEQVQFRFRNSDWQWIVGVGAPPAGFRPGPGPFNDRIRVGRVTLDGPVLDEGIDARYQAQDAFPTEIHPNVTPGAGDHYRPTTDRFGTVAVSTGTELGIGNTSFNIITGDSITCNVDDVRGAGGVTSMGIYGAIVSGPHSAMAPPPYTVGANGFFYVEGDSSRSAFTGQPFDGIFFVDLDDEYFVGGDELLYFWAAADAQGGFASLPVGLTAPPVSIDAAQQATQGMFEVGFLPDIDWDPDYLNAVAMGNKVDPNSDPAFLDGSRQRNCILYVNHLNSRRRSGSVNRTSFMYALDILGYVNLYDVYDHQGMGNTNNHLGGRATIEQAQGYSLIVYDTGNQSQGRPLMPRGTVFNLDAEKVDQDGWFEAWLAQAATSEAEQATLWLIGADLLEENPISTLYTNTMATSLTSPDQGLNANPDVEGQGSFMFHNGIVVDFSAGPKSAYSLSGGCPTIEDYDGQAALGNGVEVYRYADPYSAAVGDAAIIMNANPAASYSTILQSHAWFDIREAPGSPPFERSSANLLASLMDAALSGTGCSPGDPTDVGEAVRIEAPPLTALHGNHPNPFNPTTTIRFDLAQGGHVSLKVYDVAGRLIRTLVDENRGAEYGLTAVWDGLDDHGQPTSSGVYFYRLVAPGFSAVEKMVLMK